MLATLATQIDLDSRGVAWLAGANTKVIEIVQDKLAHGWSPEEIHFQHPHLSLAQIHAALAYYYQNQTALDQQSEASLRQATELAAHAANAPLPQRLREIKRTHR